MKTILRIGSAALALISLLTLAACKQEPSSEQKGKDPGSSQTEPGAARPDLSGYSLENPGHYTEIVNDQFEIDAKIVGADADTEVTSYYGTLPVMDIQKLGEFLDAVGDGIAEVTTDEPQGPARIAQVVTKSGGYADYNMTAPYDTYASFNISYRADRAIDYDSVLADYGPTERDETDSDNSALYREPKSFGFATVEEAQEDIRRVFKTLGVENLVATEIFYMDHETMNKVIEEGGVDYKNGPIQPGEGRIWTEEDDAYYFLFEIQKDGICTVPYDHKRTTYYYDATKIQVIYSKEGIVRCFVRMPWIFQEPIESGKSAMTANEALDLAVETALRSKPPYKRVLDELSLRYYYVQDKNRWQLQPCWYITILNKEGEQNKFSFDTHKVILINALTGEEM